MSDTAFGLLERFQKLDAWLRFAQARRFVDPLEVHRLQKLKLSIRDRLARLAPEPAPLR